VRGAEPGDSLVVDILDVSTIDWGVATLIPGSGLTAATALHG
jgi:acetamidase/formamidase